MTRSAAGVAGRPTETETITVCLRFETSWSGTYGGRTVFHDVEYP